MLSRLCKHGIALCVANFSAVFACNSSANINVTGFVGVGVADFSVNSNSVISNDAAEFFEAGINISADLGNRFVFHGQVLHRDYESLINEKETKVRFALVEWRTNFFDIGEQAIGVGRIRSGGGIFNNTRDVPFTRPSIRLPQSVYLDNLRSVYSYIDGIKLSSDFYMDSGDLSLEMAFGESDLETDLLDPLYQNIPSAEWKSDDSYYFDIRYQSSRWLLKYNYSNFTALNNGLVQFLLTNENPTNLQTSLTFEIQSHTAGVQYQKGKFELTTEYSTQKTFSEPGSTTQRVKTGISGFYGQMRYFVSPALTIFARYDVLNFELPSILGVSNSLLFADDKIKSLGVEWRINDRWLFTSEVHSTDIHEDSLMLAEVAWRF